MSARHAATRPPARLPGDGGIPLPTHVRRPAERQLGHDLGRVRIHTDARATRTAAALGARAFAHGEHLVFGAGEYAPDTTAGRRLLHHELAHVVQQATGTYRCDGPTAETDADCLAANPGRLPVRPLPAIPTPSVQRYPVPGDLLCREVVGWLDANSPYSPEWAQTRCSYSLQGGVQKSSTTLPDGRVEVRTLGHAGIKAIADCPVDVPTWKPLPLPRLREQQAWQEMRVTLDAHEAEHRKIGIAWRDILQSRYQAIDFTVTGDDQASASAAATAEVTRLAQQWQAEAQAAQDAIDPFRGALLTCPEEVTP